MFRLIFWPRSRAFCRLFLRAQENILPSFLNSRIWVRSRVSGLCEVINYRRSYFYYFNGDVRNVFFARFSEPRIEIRRIFNEFNLADDRHHLLFFMRQFPFSRLVLFIHSDFWLFCKFPVFYKNLQTLSRRGYGKRRIVLWEITRLRLNARNNGRD